MAGAVSFCDGGPAGGCPAESYFNPVPKIIQRR